VPQLSDWISFLAIRVLAASCWLQSYAAMFETGFPHEDDAGLAAVADATFAVVRRAAEAACAACKTAPRPPALMVALHVWSLTHGIATLFVGGSQGGRWQMPMAVKDLLRHLSHRDHPTARRRAARICRVPGAPAPGRDKAEFEQFMAGRRKRPEASSDNAVTQ